MTRRVMFPFLLCATIVAAFSIATADSHDHPLVSVAKHDDLVATTTVTPKSPVAGAAATISVKLVHHSRAAGDKSVTDATIAAHAGQEKDGPALTGGSDGVYTGSVTFEHGGSETLHVSITPSGGQPWLVKVAVMVAKAPHQH
jgi:hypothetical protein